MLSMFKIRSPVMKPGFKKTWRDTSTTTNDANEVRHRPAHLAYNRSVHNNRSGEVHNNRSGEVHNNRSGGIGGRRIDKVRRSTQCSGRVTQRVVLQLRTA